MASWMSFALSFCFVVFARVDAHSARARHLHGSALRSNLFAHSNYTGMNWHLFQSRSKNVVDDLQHTSFIDSIDPLFSKASADVNFSNRVQNGPAKVIFGIIFFLVALSIQWYNEERSARMETLLQQGLAECVSINPEEAAQENHGRLVHVQGLARAAIPVTICQFQNAQVTNCLKLQCTLEVLEWSQTSRTLLDGKEKWIQPRFHKEWTTCHQDSLKFKKPSPENPKLPSGIILGTFTQVCPRIELGAFVLTKEMVDSFVKFQPAMKHLPQTLHAQGFTFFANPEDEYYYMRPGVVSIAKSDILREHQVGDVRARFMCVPECEATIVAVQVQTDFKCSGTFVPYRPILYGSCIPDDQAREKRIEEGVRPLMDIRAEVGCRPKAPFSWACCTCNAIAFCCQSEKVTEEIFYASDRFDPREHPFDRMVPRNPCRVWLFRLLGWGLMYLGIAMVLAPFTGAIEHAPGLTAYNNAADFILSTIVTLAVAGCIMGLAYARYQPIMILKWLVFVILIILAPLLWGGLSSYAKTAAFKA